MNKRLWHPVFLLVVWVGLGTAASDPEPVPGAKSPLLVAGVFNGCVLEQGVVGCSVRGEDGNLYRFDENATAEALFEAIGGNWKNQRVKISGTALAVKKSAIFFSLTGISPLASDGQGEPSSGDGTVQHLLGSWQSTEDHHFVVTFHKGGKRSESYEGMEESSHYGLYRDCRDAQSQSDSQGARVKVWSGQGFQKAVCFTIDKLTADRLTLSLAGDAANTVVYQRLPGGE